jgi:Sigma-70, region 4
VAWLQPYPDALLGQVADTGANPAGIAKGRESVALAFIAALQLLPASQRAVLILRDVLAWPARDVAGLLDISVAAVNSALQRARATLAAYLPDDSTDGCRGYGLMVLTVADGQIATITGFPDPGLFPILGLPLTHH